MPDQAGEQRCAWPLDKFKRAVGRHLDRQDTNQLAAVLLSGSLAPVNLGHLYMLRQAKARVQHAGYSVCGGWLSPSDDAQASEKARSRGAAALSTGLRLHLAELAAQEDDFISVASWEASAGQSPSCVELLSSLQRELAASLPGPLEGRQVTVFLVCGSHNGKFSADLDIHKHQGLVVVPRRGIDTILENPLQRIFVTEPVPGRLDNLNSLRLCEALQSGDTAYARQALPAAVARLLLEPTPGERFDFGADLGRLGVTVASAGPWPCAKLAEQLLALSPEKGKVVALLVASGSMSPLHRGHVLMLHAAKQRLEDAGYVVLAAWLSPSGDAKALREAKAKGAMELRSAFRQKVAELSVCEDPLVSVGTWEAANEGSARPREVADALHQHVLQHFRYSLDGLSMKTFFVCGSDVVEQQGLTKGFPAQHDLGIVIVPRGSEDDVFMELPHHLVFMVDSLQGDAAMLSSTLVREAVKASDTSRAAQFMALAAARFLLAPTAMEREEFRADFDQLGVRLPAAPELSQMRQSLKEALKNWAGPSGSISTKDLSRLLRALDPSWTGQELDALLQQAASAADGRVDSDGFVDWIFSGCLQPVVTA